MLERSKLKDFTDEFARYRAIGDLHQGQAWTVHEALCRSLAHVSYHAGQIVLMARILNEGLGDWISIPKGQSRQYNANPTMEKKPEQ